MTNYILGPFECNDSAENLITFLTSWALRSRATWNPSFNTNRLTVHHEVAVVHLVDGTVDITFSDPRVDEDLRGTALGDAMYVRLRRMPGRTLVTVACMHDDFFPEFQALLAEFDQALPDYGEVKISELHLASQQVAKQNHRRETLIRASLAHWAIVTCDHTISAACDFAGIYRGTYRRCRDNGELIDINALQAQEKADIEDLWMHYCRRQPPC